MRTLLRSCSWVALALLTATAALAAGPERGYDLTANLPLAHTFRGGVVVDAASAGLVKYTRDRGARWKQAKEDGRPVAFNPGVQANLWIPVGPDVGKSLVLDIVMKPLGDDQRMDPFVNEKKVGAFNLKPGWQVLRVAIPDGTVTNGVAKVRLQFRKSNDYAGTKTAAAIRAIRLGAATAPALPDAEPALAALLDPLVFPADGGLDYYITPPSGMKLTGTAVGADIEVLGQVDGAAPRSLGKGKALQVSLDPVANKAVRLMVRARGGQAKFANAKISGGRVAAPAPAKKPKYVVFWMIDTLRADKLKLYSTPNSNGRKVETPNLDAFMREATRFDPFYIQGNESKASHATFFTGTYPVTHGVYTEEANVPDAFLTIAEAFKAAGLYTRGFCSNGYISQKWNFTQGFAEFDNFIRDNKPNSAEAIIKAALPWITANKGKSFYLYLGTADPHVTYRAHDEFIGKYDPQPYNGPYKKNLSGQELGAIKGKAAPAERDRKRIEALYENEIAYNDKYFGQLISHLKAQGIYDQTLVIVSSDHGDEFWEHGSCGHGHSVNQELVKVPLIMRLPGVFPAGKVVKSGAEGVDLLPTLLEILGQKRPADVQGMSQLPWITSDGVYPNAILASQGTGVYGLEVGAVKVIMSSEASIRTFDLTRDATEKTDVSDKMPIAMLAGLDPLNLFLSRAKQWRKSDWGAPNNLTPAFK